MDKTPVNKKTPDRPKYAPKGARNKHLDRQYNVNDVANAIQEIQEITKHGTPFSQRAIARKYHMSDATLRLLLRKYAGIKVIRVTTEIQPIDEEEAMINEVMVNSFAKDMGRHGMSPTRENIKQKL